MILIQNDQVEIDFPPQMAAFCERILQSALLMLELPTNTEISVVFVSNNAIQALNKQYRSLDKPTDVLSFAQIEDMELFTIDGVPILGDIVISLEQAAVQGTIYGHSLQRELAFLLVHGLLHLIGYEHGDNFVGSMRDKQDTMMQKLADIIE